MQGIDNYIPEISHVSRVYSDVAVQSLQYMVHVVLYPMLNIFYFYIIIIIIIIIVIIIIIIFLLLFFHPQRQ